MRKVLMLLCLALLGLFAPPIPQSVATEIITPVPEPPSYVPMIAQWENDRLIVTLFYPNCLSLEGGGRLSQFIGCNEPQFILYPSGTDYNFVPMGRTLVLTSLAGREVMQLAVPPRVQIRLPLVARP